MPPAGPFIHLIRPARRGAHCHDRPPHRPDPKRLAAVHLPPRGFACPVRLRHRRDLARGVTEPTLRISTSRTSGRAEVALAGDLDLETAPALATGLRTLTDDRIHEIVIDLRSVDFLDSSGITEIVRAAQIVSPHGGHVELCNAAESIRRVLDICGLAAVPGVRVA
jgi:anti-sigma B factor antagonist